MFSKYYPLIHASVCMLIANFLLEVAIFNLILCKALTFSPCKIHDYYFISRCSVTAENYLSIILWSGRRNYLNLAMSVDLYASQLIVHCLLWHLFRWDKTKSASVSNLILLRFKEVCFLIIFTACVSRLKHSRYWCHEEILLTYITYPSHKMTCEAGYTKEVLDV